MTIVIITSIVYVLMWGAIAGIAWDSCHAE
jgi:hypothetical protein